MEGREMLTEQEIVEVQGLRSASDRPKAPSSSCFSASPSTTLPRAHSSTTILLRSSSRVQPNDGIYPIEIKDFEENVEQTEIGKNDGTESHEVSFMTKDIAPSQGGKENNLSHGANHTTANRIKQVSANEDGTHWIKAMHASGYSWDVGVWRSSVVEMMASLVLTFTSIAAIIACLRADFDNPRIAIATTQFLIYTMCIVAAAPLSGGHLNPSFSFVCILIGHISPFQGLLYILAQSAGSVLGALFVRATVPSDVAQMYYLGGCLLKQKVLDANLDTVSLVGADFGPALVAELFFSFLLIAVALPLLILCPSTRYSMPECPGPSGTSHGPQFFKLNFASFMDPALLRAAFIIGLLLGLLIFISGQLLSPGYTSAGMNPARCFGPAVAEGGGDLWQPQWVFWLGPFLAAFLFSLLYGIIFFNHPCRRSYEDGQPVACQAYDAEVQASKNPAISFSRLRSDEFFQPSSQAQGLEQRASFGADSASRRMDVFLHIKATMQKPDMFIPVESEKSTDPLLKKDPVDVDFSASTNEHGVIILENANLSLRDLMEIPSASSSNIALKLEKLLKESQES